MKIVLLSDSLGFGGAQRQIANLAVCLKQNGHEVIFLRYRKDDFYLPILENVGIVPVLVEHRNAFFRMMKLKKAIRSFSPDVVISFMTAPNFYACMASKGRHPWKVIVSERVANEAAFRNRKMKFVYATQAKYADAIVCNSKCAQKLWEKYHPKTQRKLSTIYNIIDVPTEIAEVQKNEKCRLLVAARYEKEKNLDGLLQAIALLTAEEKQRLEVHWYGKANVVGATESVLEKGNAFVQENRLGESVFLHPATDQIYSLMAESDYVALFSHREGLPNAIIEGMTLKKPVIMSRVSDYDVLVDESNGFLCDPNSPEDIANALRAALNTTQEQRVEMGQKSHDKIQKICSREAVVGQWEQLIAKL